jgi:putative membrane protein
MSQPLASLRSNFQYFTKQRQAILFLAVMYLAGIIGIYGNIHPEFVLLTPINLLASLLIALYFHGKWTARLTQFLILSYALGFLAELFGVQTGILFGDYSYGKVLGPKVWGTPFMIGINWMLLSYTVGMLVNEIGGRWRWPLRAVMGAALMVLLDLFIEPVAIEYGFWAWDGDSVPLRNYLGWFVVALPIQAFFAYHFKGQKNKVAAWLFVFQFAFFVILGALAF